MDLHDELEPMRTRRLELVAFPAAFARALVDGDRAGASAAIGAVVSRWLVRDPGHVLQLDLAQGRESAAPRGGSRAVVLVVGAAGRRVIGSVGFHGPADERGRLEVGCRLDPAYRGHGYAGEAMAAMFEWAADRLGITRFLVAVSSPEPPGPRLMTELELIGHEPTADRIIELDTVLDGALRPTPDGARRPRVAGRASTSGRHTPRGGPCRHGGGSARRRSRGSAA